MRAQLAALLPHSPGLDWPRHAAAARQLGGPERARLLHYERLMGLAHLTVVPVALAATVVQLDTVRPAPLPTALVVAAALGYGVLWHLWLPRRWLSQAKVLLGLGVDIALCTLVVHQTGDHMSLLVFLYYLVVVTAALTLPTRATYAVCALTGAAYAALLPGDLVFRAAPAQHLGHVVVFLVSVGLVGVVGTAGAERIQSAERDLLVSLRAQRAIAEENATLTRELRAQLEQSRALAASLDEEREQTHRLADMLIRAQEEERRRVARELHDEANQTLAALLTTADLAQAHADRAGDAELVATVARLRRLAATSLGDLQRLALELRPPALDEFGLVPALVKHVAERTAGTPLRAEVRCEGRRRRLDAAVEASLYRIAQESLANVQKHAEAGSALFLLRFGRDSVRLSVSDDGCGFDPGAVAAGAAPEGVAAGRARLGLAGMRERAAIVGGRLRIDSRPGGGTRLSAVVPVAATTRRALAS